MMSLHIEPAIKAALDAGRITCPKCRRAMDEFDFDGTAIDEDGEHARFRCRFCYPPTTH